MKLVPREKLQVIRRRLRLLYGDRAESLVERLYYMIGRYGVGFDIDPRQSYWSENDVALITYADIVQREGEAPLATLKRFCDKRLRGTIRWVHILPFYPWSSDDGFSVMDYRKVKQEYGTWIDVERFAQDFKLMFDLVLNHCSAKGPWFRDFVNGIAPACDYFVTADPEEEELKKVVRPRATPLLTPTQTRKGEVDVWTTFSADQVDLDWANPDVLFEFLDILLFYISQGARIIRLDAVAFLWKRIGTDCLHLPETHEVVKLMRDFVELLSPDVILITETNVPHEENLSYFGDGDEAHMVYNFTLPPLLLHGLLRNDCSQFRDWARSLPHLPDGRAFFNFTASHDGIGVRPLQGILEADELEWLLDRVRERGGLVSFKSNPDGGKSPYELNITYCDALSVADDEKLSRKRFICSQALMLSFAGLPAVYFHSLVGTPNYHEGVQKTEHNRTINRRKYDLDELTAEIDNPDSRQGRIYNDYLKLIRRRANHPAFHPNGKMRVLDLGGSVLGFIRHAQDDSERILCLFNFTPSRQRPPLKEAGIELDPAVKHRDIIRGAAIDPGKQTRLTLGPYQAMWLTL